MKISELCGFMVRLVEQNAERDTSDEIGQFISLLSDSQLIEAAIWADNNFQDDDDRNYTDDVCFAIWQEEDVREAASK